MNKRKLTKYIILFILIISIIYLVATAASIWQYGYIDEKQSADAAIVLGATAYDSGVSPVYRERINHAIWLYNNSYVNYIILTGGVGTGNVNSDAHAAKQYALSQGVPEEIILLEEKSVITEQNIENSKIIMDENHLQTAIIVSDPLHQKRAMKMAQDCGIKAFSSPTPTTRYQSLRTKIPFLLREEFFYIGYIILN